MQTPNQIVDVPDFEEFLRERMGKSKVGDFQIRVFARENPTRLEVVFQSQYDPKGRKSFEVYGGTVV